MMKKVILLILCCVLSIFLVACNDDSSTQGIDGLSPHIGVNGNWWIGEIDTKVKAVGINGTDGSNGIDGLSPYVGVNGNWWIGGIDTEVKAIGTNGADGSNGIDGLSPYVGVNGNWWIGNEDLGGKAFSDKQVKNILNISNSFYIQTYQVAYDDFYLEFSFSDIIKPSTKNPSDYEFAFFSVQNTNLVIKEYYSQIYHVSGVNPYAITAEFVVITENGTLNIRLSLYAHIPESDTIFACGSNHLYYEGETLPDDYFTRDRQVMSAVSISGTLYEKNYSNSLDYIEDNQVNLMYLGDERFSRYGGFLKPIFDYDILVVELVNSEKYVVYLKSENSHPLYYYKGTAGLVYSDIVIGDYKKSIKYKIVTDFLGECKYILSSEGYYIGGKGIYIPSEVGVDAVYGIYPSKPLVDDGLIIVEDGIINIGAYSLHNTSLVILPKSIRSIDSNAVNSNTKKIFFEGTEYEWSKINFDKSLLDPTTEVYFYSDTEPISSGYYWKYVEGKSKVLIW